MNLTFSRTTRLFLTTCAALLLSLLGVSAASAAPANDNLSGAQVVGPVPVAVGANNIGATAEIGEPAHYNPASQSVWFSWTSSFTGTAVIDVCDRSFPDAGFQPRPNMAIYTGTNYGNLSAALADGTECSMRAPVTVGINYKIAVDFLSDEGTFTFRLRQRTPPPNDNFSGSTLIAPALPQAVTGSTIDSGWEAGEPDLGGSGSSRSVWYRWTPAVSMRVRFDYCEFEVRSGAGNRTFGLYTGASLATLVAVAEQYTNCTQDVNVAAGVQYRIAFSGDFGGEGDFSLNLMQITPPANDNFANAIPVGPALPLTAAGDNDFATDQPGEPPHGGIGTQAYNSVWYSWTSPVTATVRVQVCSPEYRPHLGLYTGNTLAALVPVGTPPPFAPYCGKVLDAVAGTTYRIAAGGNAFVSDRGPFTLDIHLLSRPANDDFAAAQSIGPDLPISLAGTTRDATPQMGEIGHSDANPRATVWYRWTPAKSGQVTLSACETTLPITLDVYTGSGLDSLERVAEGDSIQQPCPGAPDGTRFTMTAQAGQTYSIQADGALQENEPSFTLEIVSADPPVDPPVVIPPGNDPPVVDSPAAFNLKRAIKTCQKKFKGKSKKVKRKRANCIRKAKLKAAVIKCRASGTPKQKAKCVKKARKKFAVKKSKKKKPVRD